MVNKENAPKQNETHRLKERERGSEGERRKRKKNLIMSHGVLCYL